jgi:hypothetical protein
MMYYTTHYVIDWDKVKTLDDLKLIIKAINISFEPDCTDIKEIEHLTILQNKPSYVI